MQNRIYLSPPHMSGEEWKLVQEAFESNWIAPAGPHLAAFEQQMCEYTGSQYAVALASGTAALHLGLKVLGVQADDEVVVSDLTFAGSVNPISYLNAKPVFIDSETKSWNMDPNLLADFLKRRAAENRLPKVVMPVHLYGQTADIDAILELCARYDVLLVEDAAEAVGATYKGRSAGTMGRFGMLSFNGNKIITTSGGGMLITDDEQLATKVRYLSTQAREPLPYYEHLEVGYNYRLSNVLAAIGCGQLKVLEDRVEKRRAIFDYYRGHLGELPGIDFMPDAGWGRHTRWLSVITVDPAEFGATSEEIRLALERHNIELRPVWKPMHQQPVFAEYEFVGSGVSTDLFERGLCLPSGTNMSADRPGFDRRHHLECIFDRTNVPISVAQHSLLSCRSWMTLSSAFRNKRGGSRP